MTCEGARRGAPSCLACELVCSRHAAAGVSALKAAFRQFRSRLRAKECPLSGIAPPLECCEGPPRADAGAVCGFVDRAKHFAVQLLEHCRKARPLLGIARAALRGELQQRPGADRLQYPNAEGRKGWSIYLPAREIVGNLLPAPRTRLITTTVQGVQ